MSDERIKRAVEVALEGTGRLASWEVETTATGLVIYLTAAREEGPFVLVISDAAGFQVGAFFEDGEKMADSVPCSTLTAAAGTAARMVGELAGLVS
jgi:hypothetical protein